MHEIQLLRPHHQGRIFVSGVQSLADNPHALDKFGGYLCCFDAMCKMARNLEEVYKVRWCQRNAFVLCGILGKGRWS